MRGKPGRGSRSCQGQLIGRFGRGVSQPILERRSARQHPMVGRICQREIELGGLPVSMPKETARHLAQVHTPSEFREAFTSWESPRREATLVQNKNGNLN